MVKRTLISHVIASNIHYPPKGSGCCDAITVRRKPHLKCVKSTLYAFVAHISGCNHCTSVNVRLVPPDLQKKSRLIYIKSALLGYVSWMCVKVTRIDYRLAVIPHCDNAGEARWFETRKLDYCEH